MTSVALAGALYSQRPPSELIGAFEGMLAVELGGTSVGERLRRMRSAPLGKAKLGRDADFERASFLKRLASGKYRCLIGAAGVSQGTGVHSPDYLHFYTDAAPVSSIDDSTEKRCWRYEAAVIAAPELVAVAGPQAIADMLVCLAQEAEVRAGVVLAHPSLSGASSLLDGGTRGLTEEEAAKAERTFYQRYDWGDKIRGPEWGTFLSAHHVRALGGHDALEAACNVARFIRLRSGGAYLEVTGDPADLDTASGRAAVAALRQCLASVMIEEP